VVGWEDQKNFISALGPDEVNEFTDFLADNLTAITTPILQQLDKTEATIITSGSEVELLLSYSPNEETDEPASIGVGVAGASQLYPREGVDFE
jgi:hypothetical protein